MHNVVREIWRVHWKTWNIRNAHCSTWSTARILNISPFPRFSVFLAIFQVLQCAYLLFHVVQCFSPCFRSWSFCFLFSTFLNVSTRITSQTVFMSHNPCVCFWFSRFCSVSCHYQGPIMGISHFPCFSVLLAIFRVLQCAFSFSTFYSVLFCFFSWFYFLFVFLFLFLFFFFCHFSGPTVCISHFPGFSVFLAIFQVLNCPFLISHDFQCFSPCQVILCLYLLFNIFF